MSKKIHLSVLLSLCLGWLSPQVQAATLFDFEDQAYGSHASISSTVGGITATIYRENENALTVLNIGPPSWQTHSLIGTDFPDPIPPQGLIANFSTALGSASIQFGDFGGDDDLVWLEAWSGLDATGTLLASNSFLYPATLDISNGDADVRSLSVSGVGIQSLRFYSTVGFPDSVYWDNLSVSTSVPEPASLGLLAIGLACVRMGKRRPACKP